MTRIFLSLATAFSLITFSTMAEDYYYGQNGYYAPQYYTPPATPPPGASPVPEPPATTVINTYSAPPVASAPATVTVYNNNPPPSAEVITWWEPTPYFRAGVGPAYFQNSMMKQYGVPANDSIKYKVGGTVNAAAGYTFNPYLAGDLELGLWGASVDRINFFTFDRANLYELPVTANIIFDWPLQDGNLVPYFGGGAGGSVAIFEARNFSTSGSPTIDGTEADVVFAGQIFAGVRFRLSPHVWIGGEYRFFCTTQPNWDYPGGFRLSIGGLEADAAMFTVAWKF